MKSKLKKSVEVDNLSLFARRPACMLVLDLDGVVTDPQTNEVSGDVLKRVAADLKRGVAVAFNTGRALDWVEKRILRRLSAACTSEELAGLLIVSEKGGVLGFMEEGRLRVELDVALAPPAEFVAAAKALLGEDYGGSKLSGSMFWDAAKQTMVSIERRPEISLDDFHEAQKQLNSELEKLMRKHNLADFGLEETVIATDIQHRRAGKHLGAEHVLAWLKEHGVAPQSFTAIGDSPGDADMADVFAGVATTTFVYVGDLANFMPSGHEKYEIITTGGGYAKDTAKYLDTLA